MKNSFKILCLLMIIGMFFNIPITQAQDANQAKEPEIIAVFNHADWCKGCQKLKPKLNAIKPEFKDQGVLFTGFNKTNDFTKQQSQLLARELGLSQLYKKYKDQTAFVVLLDAQTKEELDILKWRQSKEKMKQSIAAALNR